MLFSTDFGANFATQKMGCEKLYCCKGVVVNYLTRDLLSTCIFKNQQLPSLSTPLWLCSFVLDQEQCDKNNIEQLEIMDYQGKKSSLLITLRTLNFSHLSIFPFCRGCRTIILQLMILAFQLIQQFWHFQANQWLKITQKSNGLLGYFAEIILFGSNNLQNV